MRSSLSAPEPADGEAGSFTARLLDGTNAVAAADWDACAGEDNPFTRHAFLHACEASGSASPRTGWRPLHIAIDDAGGRPLAILPAYLKSHSQGEYVFDYSWADAFQRAGGRYYPKLQSSIPFTPATTPKLLLRAGAEALAPALLRAAEAVIDDNGLSGAHATFIRPEQLGLFEDAGWLIRHDIQFHWRNDGYTSWDDFLADLASRKRKALRKERDAALAEVEIMSLTGADLREEHWDAFFGFYMDTGSRKWGRPYLTRAYFSMIGETMPERILLMMARRGDRWIAGALNFIGGDCLYGRQWGCIEEVPFLHFELCYHQAIEWACVHGLARVEAGAQGEHKLARGYRPVVTKSAHYLADDGLRQAVAAYLARERPAIDAQALALDDELPFKREG